MGNVGIPPTGKTATATAINASGIVVGNLFNPDALPTLGNRHAFMYSNGVIKDIGTLGGSVKLCPRY